MSDQHLPEHNQSFSGKANAAIGFAGAVGELSYINGSDDAPSLLFHSSNDNTVPFNSGVPYGAGRTQLPRVFGSNAINDDARSKGAPVRFKSYTNRGHSVHTRGGGNFYPEIIPDIADFLFEVINGGDTTPPPPPPTPTDIPFDQVISLRKKGGDRKYVTAERFANNNQLLARGARVLAWETFRVEEHPQGGVALKAISNDKYIQVNGNNQNVPIRALGNQKLEWEQFNWRNLNPGEVALQSAFTGRWIQAAWPTNNAVLYARGAQALTWETFEWKVENASRGAFGKSVSMNTEVFPNPVGNSSEININAVLNSKGDVNIQIMDTSGRTVYSDTFSDVSKGGSTFSIKTNTIKAAPGVYIVHVTANGVSETNKVIF